MFSIFSSKKNKTPKKIGVLYICTGSYAMFWDKFYKTANKYFCKNSDIHYFVFTDREINKFGNENVHKIHQSKLGWPYDTLNRFHFFLEQKETLEKMDYLFFFNANMLFNKTILEEDILPTNVENGLVSVLHPYYCNYDKIAPFEDNKDSEAYVAAKIEMNYFQGCLSGGKTKAYLEMAEAIKIMVEIDKSNSIIAKWHDESLMNKYFQSNPPKLLSPSYAYPEGTNFSFSKKIIQLDKRKLGGHEYLRK
jgi:Glycosyltransferase family 6